MGLPLIQMGRIGTYALGRTLSGDRRYPLVLMLEPLFRCNLRCKSCGKISFPDEVLDKRLSKEECIEAAEECGAPVVSIPGGEPLLHPEIGEIVRGLVARKRFVYLCTNGLLVPKRIDELKPSPYLNVSLHLDGLRPRHDSIVNREGVFDKAVESIRLLLSRGFRVTTNTTLYGGETPENAAALFDFIMSLGVEAMTVSAGFSYDSAADQNLFLDRRRARDLFRKTFALGRNRGWRFNHSGLYLEFLTGKRELACSPWGTPARNVFGWQKPCYLLDDGYVRSYRELLRETDWDSYGPGRDPRCTDCLLHSGFEPSAVAATLKAPWLALASPLK